MSADAEPASAGRPEDELQLDGSAAAEEAAAEPEAPELDITGEAAPEDTVEVEIIPPHTAEWAEVVKPVTRAILAILAAVILLPFLFVFLPKAQMEVAVDWAKTVLPAVVGIVGGVVGYYFGTRRD